MKQFDCVQMKRKGADRVRRETAGMSKDEVLASWQRGTEELLQEQAALRRMKAQESLKRDEQPLSE